MENFPYFVRNLNPRLYIAQIQNLFKENYQTFFYKNLHEESSSAGSSMDEQFFSCEEFSRSDKCRSVGHDSLKGNSYSLSDESSSVNFEHSDEESSSSSEESSGVDLEHSNEESSSSSDESSSLDFDTSVEESSSSSDESSSLDFDTSVEESSSSSSESGSVDFDTSVEESSSSSSASGSVDVEHSDEESSSSTEESNCVDFDTPVEESSSSSSESSGVDFDTSVEESSSLSDESSSLDFEHSNEESSSSSDESSSVDHDRSDEESSSSIEEDPLTLSTLNSFLVISAILSALSSAHFKNEEEQSTATESTSLDKHSSADSYFLLDEESSSGESSYSQEYSVYNENYHMKTAFQNKTSIVTEQTEENSQLLNPVEPFVEFAKENKQEILGIQRAHTDLLDIEKNDQPDPTFIAFPFSSKHADTDHVKEDSEEKRGLISLFESLPSNYPVKSIITNGTEIYVSFFIQYEDDQQLVYFSDDENVITIECHRIDGIIFANDVDCESYD